MSKETYTSVKRDLHLHTYIYIHVYSYLVQHNREVEQRRMNDEEEDTCVI